MESVALYGLLGYPLGHSFSKNFFSNKFTTEHIQAQYENFERENLHGIREWLDEKAHLKGFNITIPYKKAIIPFLDALSPEAKAIGAVNVVKVVNKEGKREYIGYNSDVIGFIDSLVPLLHEKIKRAMVLGGTGGAAKAVIYGLHKIGIDVTIVSRCLQPLDKREQGNIARMTYDDINEHVLKAHLLLVNCTPLGMFPRIETAPPIQYDALGSDHLLYDLVYNPEHTRFLALGQEHGARIKNGLEMLHLQALAAWKIWNNLME